MQTATLAAQHKEIVALRLRVVALEEANHELRALADDRLEVIMESQATPNDDETPRGGEQGREEVRERLDHAQRRLDLARQELELSRRREARTNGEWREHSDSQREEGRRYAQRRRQRQAGARVSFRMLFDS